MAIVIFELIKLDIHYNNYSFVVSKVYRRWLITVGASLDVLKYDRCNVVFDYFKRRKLLGTLALFNIETVSTTGRLKKTFNKIKKIKYLSLLSTTMMQIISQLTKALPRIGYIQDDDAIDYSPSCTWGQPFTFRASFPAIDSWLLTCTSW